jgi:small subunit ribosomal protein S6
MNYELTLILDPDLTTDAQKKLVTKIKKIIEDPSVDEKGKVEKTDDWGKKDFVYPIAKKNFGYYLLVKFSASGKGVIGVDKKLKSEEGILRYLLVKREDPISPPVGGSVGGTGGSHGAKIVK